MKEREQLSSSFSQNFCIHLARPHFRDIIWSKSRSTMSKVLILMRLDATNSFMVSSSGTDYHDRSPDIDEMRWSS